MFVCFVDILHMRDFVLCDKHGQQLNVSTLLVVCSFVEFRVKRKLVNKN